MASTLWRPGKDPEALLQQMSEFLSLVMNLTGKRQSSLIQSQLGGQLENTESKLHQFTLYPIFKGSHMNFKIGNVCNGPNQFLLLDSGDS